MKKITLLNSILIAIISIFFQINSNAQTLVNREWVTTGGNPNEHFEYISGAGANGFIYIVGSTYRSNQQDNFFIAKIVDDGTIYWIKEFNSLTDYRDFGIDIVAKDTLIYVTGMSWDSISGTSKIVTLRLDDNNGNIVWAQSWGSRYNVPVKITADNNGNVYVGGTAETSASEFAMVVLKYSPSGSLDWASTYDSTGVIDGAVALVLDSPQNYLTITGYSGNGFNNWDFTTVQMDVSTGNIKNTTITQNGNGGFNKPVGISGDGTTTYIGGTVTHPTTGKKRMKIIGYDYQWQEVNLSYYGDSLTETEVVDMHNDFTGANVLLATHTRTDGHKEIIVARYALSDGSLLWDRTLSAPTGEDAEAGSFTIAGDANNIYLTGSIKSSSGRHRMLTAAYDLDGNLIWMKEYNRTSTSDDRGKTVDADEDGNPITTGVSTDNDTSTYTSVKYSQWSPSNACLISRSNCPDISYKFSNGNIVPIGSDTFVEFDILAKQNNDSLPYKGGNIIFAYNTNAFGNTIVDSSYITITKGTIIEDSSYIITAKDTLYNSDILSLHSNEVSIVVNSLNDTALYVLSDTFQELFHVKMKLRKKAPFEIKFDKFFMEDKSDYFDKNRAIYNYVNTGNEMVLSSNVDLTYSFANILTNLTSTIPTVSFDIMMKANGDNRLADLGFTVYYNPNVVSIPNYNCFSFAGWISKFYSSSSSSQGLIYQEDDNYSNALGKFTITVQHFDDATNPFDPSDQNIQIVPHSFNPALKIVTVTMSINDCVDPQLTFQNPCLEVNQFADPDANFLMTNFNVKLGSDYTTPLCFCKTADNPCLGMDMLTSNMHSLNVYPNPFNNRLTIDFFNNQEQEISLRIENTLGQIVYTESWVTTYIGNNSRLVTLPSSFPNGIYLAKLKTNNLWSTTKIVKE